MANKFITLLDKLGADFKLGAAKAIAIEEKLIPLEQTAAAVVTAFNPAAGGTIEAILGSVVGVEGVAKAVGAGTGTGARKLVAAIPGVEQALFANPLFKGKVPANLALYNTAIAVLTGAFADLLNSFEGLPTITPVAAS